MSIGGLPAKVLFGARRAFCLLLLVTGCATGPIREVRVAPLAGYPGLDGIAVAVSGAGEPALHEQVARGAGRVVPPAVGATLRLRFDVVEARTAAGQDPGGLADRALSAARSYAGLAGAGAAGMQAGRLVLDVSLFAPDGTNVGGGRWEREGAPELLAEGAGEDLAGAIARLVPQRRRERFERRAADERLLLTPTPLTLAPGEVVLSDDEVLMVRLAVGVSRRVQLDLWTGGFPVPAAGAGGLAAGHGIVAVAGAGVAVLGFLDLGIKVNLLDETDRVPGLAVAYDLLDLFGGAVGTGGLVLFGSGAGGVGYGVVGGATAQFNLLTVVAGKHFGPLQITAGTYVLDNHHFLPQSAGFQACGFAASDSMSTAADGTPCGSGGTQLGRLPMQVQPFVGSELILGRHSALMLELLPRDPLRQSLATTGVRWLLGDRHARGFLAANRIRFRADLGLIWEYFPGRDGSMPRKAGVGALPWLGLGVYFM